MILEDLKLNNKIKVVDVGQLQLQKSQFIKI